MKIRAKDRQTLADIGLQYGGSYEAGVETAIRNGLSVTERLADGQELTVGNTPEDADGLRVVTRYAVAGVEPATEASDADMAACPYGGIGYMGIEIDFTIS